MEYIYHHRTQGRGGEGVHISSVVLALERAGHRAVVISPPGVDPMRSAGAVPVDKIRQKVSGIHRLWRAISKYSPQILFELVELSYNVFTLFRLGPKLRRKGPVIYYERYAFFLIAGVWMAKRKGIPVILEVNEIAGVVRARGLILERVACRLERMVFQMADAIIVVSSFLAEEVERRGARRQAVSVMPNAIDSGFFDNASGENIRREFNLDDTTVIGFVGWFDYWDRLDLLIDVVASLRERHPELRLLLVGDGPMAMDLRKKVVDLAVQDFVIMPGPVPRERVPSFLQAMDIGVLPNSNLFGSPIVLFEMMVSGLAVVAPDVAPVKDVIAHESTGLIFPHGEAAALSEAISTLLTDSELRMRLGTNARERALEKHTWTATALRIAELAEGLIMGKGGGETVRQQTSQENLPHAD